MTTTHTVELTVTITVDGDPDKMVALVTEHLTGRDHPLRGDYGPPTADEIEAFGGRSDGYDGPFLTNVEVTL